MCKKYGQTNRLRDCLQRRFFLVRIHLPLFRLIGDLEVLRIQYSGLCEAFDTAYWGDFVLWGSMLCCLALLRIWNWCGNASSMTVCAKLFILNEVFSWCMRSMKVFVIMLRLLALEHLRRCSLQEYFSHPSLFFYFFPTTTGTANRWETTNSKTPGPIIMVGQTNWEQLSDHLYYTFSGRC
jgi:hypothetical protein